MGLAGYNQYFELVTEPANFTTTCSYDRIALGNASWGNASWMFTRLDDLTGTGTDPTATQMQPGSIEISYQSPASPTMLSPHRVRKWGIAAGAAGDRQYINVLGAGYSSPATQVFNGYTYDYGWREDPGLRDDILKSSLGGSCPASIPNYNGGTCTTQACDLTLEFPLHPIRTGTCLAHRPRADHHLLRRALHLGRPGELQLQRCVRPGLAVHRANAGCNDPHAPTRRAAPSHRSRARSTRTGSPPTTAAG